MGSAAIGSNLRRIRSASGLTQAELAERAGISRVGYRNIETGKSLPRVDTLNTLASALGVRIQELVTPVAKLARVRFRALKRLNTRESILASVARWLGDYGELETLLDEVVEDAPPSGMPRDPVKAARAVRESFGLDGEEPIRDICGLLEARGIKVLSIKLASPDFFGLSVGAGDGGPAIVVNTWERISVERWIFTAAHELGHLVLHPGDYDVSKFAEEKDREQAANVFAAHLLMPADSFEKEWAETAGLPLVDRVFKVKRIFHVSYKTVLYRLREHVSSQVNVWQLFQNEYRARYGRTLLKEEEPNALQADAYRASFPESTRAGEPDELSPSDFQGDRLSFLVRKGVERGEVSLARGAEILNLPLADMRARAATWLEDL